MDKIPGTRETFIGGKCFVYEIQDGITHRDDGPAIIWEDGEMHWYHHGKIHRIDGPAIIRRYDRNEWWWDGRQYSFDRWLEINDEIDEQDKCLIKLRYG